MPNRVRDLESQVERLDQQLRLFQKISRMMVRELSLTETLNETVTLVTGFMECDSCLVYLLDKQGLVLCASNSRNQHAIGNVRLRLDEGLTGWVARERRLLAISREAYKDPRFKFFTNLPEDTYEAFLSAPVIARNQVVGVINVQHRDPHSHSGSEMELLTTVGELVGCALMLARITDISVESDSHANFVLGSAARN